MPFCYSIRIVGRHYKDKRVPMVIKKLSAALALLSIAFLLVHIGYSVFAYLTMYYNPQLKLFTAVPILVAVCLHAVFGMISVFTQADGTRLDLYGTQNRRTVLQRVTAALIFPLLILHMNTFGLMSSAAEQAQPALVLLLMLAEILFFAVVIAHVAVSLSKAFVTLGWVGSKETLRRMDRVAYVVGAVLFVVSAFAIVKTQMAMFLG